MAEEIVEKEIIQDKKSLKEFIDDYQKTIAVIGVFVALGLFWKNMHPDKPTPYISYLCFLITIPLLLEVNKGYSKETASWNLRVFIEIFSIIFVLTTLSLITDYPEHLATVVTVVTCTLLYFGAAAINDKVFTWLKDRRYRKVVKMFEVYNERETDADKRSEFLKLINKDLKLYRLICDVLSVIFLILIILFNLIAYIYLSQFLHGVAIINNDIPEVQSPIK